MIPVLPVLAFVLFYLYIVDNGYSPYHEGIGLTRFSEDEFQKYVKEVGSLENLNVIKLTSEELEKEVPVIKRTN